MQQLAWRRMWERSILGVAGILPMSVWGYVIGANGIEAILMGIYSIIRFRLQCAIIYLLFLIVFNGGARFDNNIKYLIFTVELFCNFPSYAAFVKSSSSGM